MKILLTGANGYIGKRLLPLLIADGHHVVCSVRDASRFSVPEPLKDKVSVIQVDLLNEGSLDNIPDDITGAYYLVHSMSNAADFKEKELMSAVNFRKALSTKKVDHVIYLSGMVNEEQLSEHLSSRKAVEDELARGDFHLTTLRAGIIIGSGSASFEIIRDLVEKLPVMVAPKWLKTKCQPIGVHDVMTFLRRSLFNEKAYDQDFDIGGPDVLSYREMLFGYAGVRGLKRLIINVPVMTPRLSSYWLYFITSTSYKLATALVDSMKIEVVCRDRRINEILDVEPESYKDALLRTLSAIEGDRIVSSWKDSFISGRFQHSLTSFITVPTHGCFVDSRQRRVENDEKCLEKIWSVGGETGWYYANILWRIRGFIDKLWGGVGLRRGRTDPHKISNGDAIDFWRVLLADREGGRLLLFAEMKLPGEAWLELKVSNGVFTQTATFRPKGLYGRLYWYVLLPVHNIIFNGMSKNLAS